MLERPANINTSGWRAGHPLTSPLSRAYMPWLWPPVTIESGVNPQVSMCFYLIHNQMLFPTSGICVTLWTRLVKIIQSS